MANRRMFSKEVVRSDKFTEMSSDAQSLYFHLGMDADDDGFVTPKGIMRLINAPEDALRVLIAKNFVIPFESGVVVVRDWKENNFLRNDRYKPTQYKEEMAQLSEENGRYTIGIPLGYQRSTQDRIGEGSIGKDRDTGATKSRKEESRFSQDGAEIIKAFEVVDPKNKTYYGNTTQRGAADFLIKEYGKDEVLKRIAVLPRSNKVAYFPTITTPVQLRDKWVQLEDAVFRAKNNQKGKVAFV